MSYKHTPAPWKIEDSKSSTAPEIITDDRRIARVLYDMGSEDREVDANARLIVSAPELLEALEDIFEHHKRRLPLEVLEKIYPLMKKAGGNPK